MDVDDFAAYAGLSIDFERTANWLALPALSPGDDGRLRALCRLPAGDLPAPYDGEKPARLAYCHRCLYLNPVDVTAPFWQARWLLGADASWCATHGQRHERTTPSAVRNHRNTRRLLGFIGRQRAAQQWAAQWKRRTLAGFMAR